MTAGAYLPLWSVPSVTSQMEGLLALTPTTLTPFFTLALWETARAQLRRRWGTPGYRGLWEHGEHICTRLPGRCQLTFNRI